MKGKQSLGLFEQRMLGRIYLGMLGVFSINLLALALAGILVRKIEPVVSEASLHLRTIADDTLHIKAAIHELQERFLPVFDEQVRIMKAIRSDADTIKKRTGVIRDLSATMQASLGVVETTILAIRQQFTNLLTRLAPVEDNVGEILSVSSDILLRMNQVVSDLGVLRTEITEINGKMPIGTFLERLNAEVNGMDVANLDFFQIDLDMCEYDPLGIGPINCEGLESEAGILQGVKFTFI